MTSAASGTLPAKMAVPLPLAISVDRMAVLSCQIGRPFLTKWQAIIVGILEDTSRAIIKQKARGFNEIELG